MFGHNQLFFTYANISNPTQVYLMKICALVQRKFKQTAPYGQKMRNLQNIAKFYRAKNLFEKCQQTAEIS